MGPLDIYILGAGASFVHGAPLTKDILPYALKHAEDRDLRRFEIVKKFLHDIFHFEYIENEDNSETFPSLVDIMSVVDFALDHKESLARGYNYETLLEVRASLEYSIFRALEHSLSHKTLPHRRRSKATKELVSKLNPVDSVIISLNYDVIIDIALAYRHKTDFKFDLADVERLSKDEANTIGIDYGVEFANMTDLAELPFRLYKLHGSFNWLFSKLTGNLYFGGLSKAVAKLFDEKSEILLDIERYYNDSEQQFSEWKSDLAPILITPTHLKDLRNAHISNLWRKAEASIRAAKRLTFIGYSLPADDIHLKYMIKRAIETGDITPEIIVVDYWDKPNQISFVEDNYRRFFGVLSQYYRHGYERYVKEEMSSQ